jgi:hypothetical protein
MTTLRFLILLSFFFCLTGFRLENTKELRSKISISSWLNPTEEDFKKLETYHSNFYDSHKESLIPLFKDKRFNLLKNFKFSSTDKVKLEKELQKIYFNGDPNKKDQCIICYISCHRNYYLKLQRLIDYLKLTKYKGHLIYRIGGWPDTQNGSLFYFNTPYAFKPFLFNEVKNLGYKKVLFLDTSICLKKPVNEMFDWISDSGFVLYSDNQRYITTISTYLIESIKLTEKETSGGRRFCAGILGLNFRNPKCVLFLNKWIAAAKARTPFLCRYPEEGIMSALLYRLKIDKNRCEYTKKIFNKEDPFIKISRGYQLIEFEEMKERLEEAKQKNPDYFKNILTENISH